METRDTYPGIPSERATAQHPEGTPDVRRPMVVGIGASAGGIQALQTFFAALPAHSGIAFVVVMHLSPEHESSLPQVLQAHTAMPVAQVRERVRMEPDHVYVIPPNQNIEITNGHLVLSDFEALRWCRSSAR